ncbi:MAG TPA: M1 family peptidase, partial [Actinomycetota bacterium]|nr:M1 family peptidase [Actinomycetota bacterium]
MRRPLALRALVVALVVSVALGVVSVSAVGAPIVRTPGHPSYEFRLRSGEAGRTWQGSGSITFTNVGSDPLPEIYLRVWSNGVHGCAPRAIVVTNVRGGTLSGETLECTELEVTLDEVLAPAETATISFGL